MEIPKGYAIFLISDRLAVSTWDNLSSTTSRNPMRMWGVLIIGAEYRKSEIDGSMTTRLELVSDWNPFTLWSNQLC